MIGILREDEIEEILKNNLFGHLGCNDGFNTFVLPISYVFDGKYIICHSAMGGKIKVMQQNSRVCFQVEEIKSINSWKSVLVLGHYQELADERDRYYAMKLLVNRNLHVKTNEMLPHAETEDGNLHIPSEGNRRPVFYRIIVSEKSGRFENE